MQFYGRGEKKTVGKSNPTTKLSRREAEEEGEGVEEMGWGEELWIQFQAMRDEGRVMKRGSLLARK